MPVIKLSDGRSVTLPEGMSRDDQKVAIDAWLTKHPAENTGPKISIPVLRAGQKVTESGPEFDIVTDLNDERLTDQQRQTIKGMIAGGEYNPDAPPGSIERPIFKQAGTNKKGKKTLPIAPVDASYIDDTGKSGVQKAKKSQMLGLTTGIRRATNNVGSAAGIPFFKEARKRDADMEKRAEQAGVKGGIVGDIVGSTIGTYPYLFATKNPMIAGAGAGGLNTREDTLEGVAKDAAIGAIVGKGADVAVEGAGKVIAPQVSNAIRALAEKGVELTPGQVMGGTVRNVEETLAGFPIIGGLVSDARSRSTDTFNRAIVDDVLGPLGRPGTPRAPTGVPPSQPGAPGLPSPQAGPPPMLARPGPAAIEGVTPPIQTGPPPMLAAPQPAAAVTRPAASGVGPQVTPPLKPAGPRPGIPEEEIIDTTAEAVGKAATAAPEIATKLPKNVETGNDAMQFAHRQISKAYDDVIPRMTVKMDDPFMVDIQRITALTSEMTPDLANVFNKTMRERLVAPLETPGASLTGQKLKDLTSYLSSEARDFSRSMDPMQRKLGNAYSEAATALKEMAKRQNPADAKRLADVDEAYGMLLRVEKAAGKASSTGGVFGPSDLRSAVTQLDRTANKRASAQGRATLQKEADDAVEVLGARGAYGSQVPSRALLMGGAGAAAAGANGVVNPALGALLASPMLAYSKTGTALIRNAMLKRPPGAKAAREALKAAKPPISVAAAANSPQEK